MPNWCENELELTHSDPLMIERAKDSFVAKTFLNEFVPMPLELRGTISPSKEEDEEANASLRAKHGWDNWYDWSTNNWGTKWDIGKDGVSFYDSRHPNNLILNFRSAWSPPIKALEKIAELGFTLRLFYWEPGMCYTGVFKKEGRKSAEYEFYELTELNSKEILKLLPWELDNRFGISNFIKEMEEPS